MPRLGFGVARTVRRPEAEGAMIRLTAITAAALGLVVTSAAQAQSVDASIAEGRALVRRAAQPFVRQAEADACARELARALVTGRAALRGLTGEGRARAADALNLTTIHAAFGRVTATRGLDVTRDLLPLDEATALLDLEHLDGEQRARVLRCLTVLHDLSRRPAGERADLALRALVERDLDACEADLRAMVNDPALATYLRGLAHHHEALTRAFRARVVWVGGLTIHRTWPLAHVSAIVDEAYVGARRPGASPQAREVELRGLTATTRAGAVLPCAVRLDAPSAPEVARWDVETIDAAGARVALRRVSPASASFELFAPSRAGRYTVLVSALLADDRVVARAFPLEVTGPEVPTISLPASGEVELPARPSVGLAGALAR